MSTDKPRAGRRTAPAPGALLLCLAEPGSVAPVAQLLRERMLLTGAGERWSVLVPEGKPWQHGDDPVERVLTGWATALAVGAPWPVLALWWDADRAGYTLAAGFRRPVGYVWLANGTPAGEDEAMRTFAARLGLDPVLDVPVLDRLTRPDPAADACARLRALLGVLTRAGVTLAPGLTPGEPADRLREVARVQSDAQPVEATGRPRTVRAEPDTAEHGRTGSRIRRTAHRVGPWLPHTGDPRARTLALAQLAAGLPLTAWALRRRSAGWTAAGVLLLAHGALGLAYDLARPRD
ncbi:hypothetical protein [Streptomyces sp. TRM68367]|uniref:hypothetical protein n=1 Tax=Streptomyces sp. TRM68367 TaxID=2758415 RepID=UPI00165C151D|nr:hypothetical protein [Streptomyces sp. TRM68367]MBC9725326.1 hypothetical protein [Streptomyces sp. TRM68367]